MQDPRPALPPPHVYTVVRPDGGRKRSYADERIRAYLSWVFDRCYGRQGDDQDAARN